MKDNTVVRVQYSIIDADGFDYATVTPDVARYLRGHAARLRQYISKSIIQIGKDLLSAKRYLPHGAFLEWVEREAGINPRTAQSYMHAAEWASNKSATVARLPPGLLYILSAASTPPKYVDDIVQRVESGERITLAKVRSELRKIQEIQIADRCSNRLPVAISDTGLPPVGAEGILTVARILATALPTEKFRTVRSILTSSSVLSHPDLADAILMAFRTIETSPSF